MMERAATRAALLAAGARGDDLDRRIFASILATALADTDAPLLRWLGLSPAMTRLLAAAYFPAFPLTVPDKEDAGPLAVEEEDLRLVLLRHRAGRRPEEEWLAAILARRAQAPNHLWEDLGLLGRDDLNGLMNRYFPALFARNVDNMRWKKFFYRLMCEDEGLRLCKSPSCDLCSDLEICFEPGSRLLMRAAG